MHCISLLHCDWKLEQNQSRIKILLPFKKHFLKSNEPSLISSCSVHYEMDHGRSIMITTMMSCPKLYCDTEEYIYQNLGHTSCIGCLDTNSWLSAGEQEYFNYSAACALWQIDYQPNYGVSFSQSSSASSMVVSKLFRSIL